MTTAIEKIVLVDVEEIESSPYQYRRYMDPAKLEEFADNVKEHGVLQPVLLRAVKGKTHKGIRHQLVAGHRRWAAAKRAGLRQIPAVIKVLSDLESAKIALMENVQREDPDDWTPRRASSRDSRPPQPPSLLPRFDWRM